MRMRTRIASIVIPNVRYETYFICEENMRILVVLVVLVVLFDFPYKRRDAPQRGDDVIDDDVRSAGSENRLLTVTSQPAAAAAEAETTVW